MDVLIYLIEWIVKKLTEGSAPPKYVAPPPPPLPAQAPQPPGQYHQSGSQANPFRPDAAPQLRGRPAQKQMVRPAQKRAPVRPPAPQSPAQRAAANKMAGASVGSPGVSARSAASAKNREASKNTRRADAAALRSWMQPSTMRAQFILTELLQPPMALRPPRD
jgi:hypothetical protein